MVLLGAMYLPDFFKAKPKFADIYTVSLVNISEPVQTGQPGKVQEPSPPKAAPKPPPTPSAPPKTKQPVPAKAIPVEDEAPKEVKKIEPAPPKAVSLKPLKQKKVMEIKEPEPSPKKTAIDRKEIQKLAEALREEEILAEKARIAREALEQERQILAESIKSLNAARQPSTAAEQQSGTAAASSGSASLIESQYHAAIFSRLQQFWSLPEYMQKDQSLTAVVVITIQQDGEVANMVFESKSGDRVFDQFVSKTIAAANPLPPIPPAMKKQRYEIGLRFKPDRIQ
jgi:TonB family protein